MYNCSAAFEVIRVMDEYLHITVCVDVITYPHPKLNIGQANLCQ